MQNHWKEIFFLGSRRGCLHMYGTCMRDSSFLKEIFKKQSVQPSESLKALIKNSTHNP